MLINVNRHAKCAKIDGFWDVVTRDPGDYQGRHQLDPLTKPHQLWFGTLDNGCPICRSALHSS